MIDICDFVRMKKYLSDYSIPITITRPNSDLYSGINAEDLVLLRKQLHGLYKSIKIIILLSGVNFYEKKHLCNARGSAVWIL